MHFLKIFIGVGFIGALALYLHGYTPKPKSNPNPKYYVMISGIIDPAISNPIALGFWARYAGYNPECSKTGNILAGTKVAPAQTSFYPAKPDPKTGRYEVKIPIDAYQAGECGWKIMSIMYTYNNDAKMNSDEFENKGVATLMQFGRATSSYENPGRPLGKYQKRMLTQCDSSVFACEGSPLGSFYTNSVPRVQNYKFSMSFMK